MILPKPRPTWIVCCAAGLCAATGLPCHALTADQVAARLTPQPRQLTLGEGEFRFKGVEFEVQLPAGLEHEGCRAVAIRSLKDAGAGVREKTVEGNRFVIGEPAALPELPAGPHPDQAYVLVVSDKGVAARAGSPAALLYAAQTLRQLMRISSEAGRIQAVTIVDSPDFKLRGIYVEGGQERFGRLVAKDYFLAQIQRLSEFKMNALVLECYNLLPYASFPGCTDEGTLSPEAVREIVAESKRYHVTLIPSLQTLAQAYELVWLSDQGIPYREATAPGMMCPSNPAIYPMIAGLYRDLLTWFDESPIIGIGCSEIDMQWQQRYCPACKKRVEAGETVRDLLLGHAIRCIDAVHKVSSDLGRPVRPVIWADEFYMYGPGKDWVGIEKISKDTVMGYWKYWPDYAGIGGLLERGYDVLGVSAMYNHTFYLADLSPGEPPKLWPPMEQTGVRNIAGMLASARQAQRPGAANTFWGVATASFSKHRLRAFDSIWYGFALNGHAGWSRAEHPLEEYQEAFTRAFTRHYYDARTDQAADALARAYTELDRCKSQLELANQTLNDVVGVYDTQEPGYRGNALMGAFRRCGTLMDAEGRPSEKLAKISDAARGVVKQAGEMAALIDQQKTHAGCTTELDDLRLAAEKIAAHAERQLLMIDTQSLLAAAEGKPVDTVRGRLKDLLDRWALHHARMDQISQRSRHLYSRADPLGLAALLADIAAIEAHLKQIESSNGAAAAGALVNVLLDERFEALGQDRWIVLGEPRIAGGHMETRAPGGWGKNCGLITREPLKLMSEQPLIVELELTPLTMGVDSQLIAAAGEKDISFRFAVAGSVNHLDIHTQSATRLQGQWSNPEPGWKLRSSSPPLTLNKPYRLRMDITNKTCRATLRESDQKPLQPPLWDSGIVPMDDLAETRLMFADVEPEGGKGATRWGPIRIGR